MTKAKILGYGELDISDVASLHRICTMAGWKSFEKWLTQMQLDLGRQALKPAATEQIRDQLAAQNHWIDTMKQFGDHVESELNRMKAERDRESAEKNLDKQ